MPCLGRAGHPTFEVMSQQSLGSTPAGPPNKHQNIGFDTFVQQLLSLNFVFSFEVEIRRIFSQSLVELRQQSPCPKIAHVFMTLNLFV